MVIDPDTARLFQEHAQEFSRRAIENRMMAMKFSPFDLIHTVYADRCEYFSRLSDAHSSLARQYMGLEG